MEFWAINHVLNGYFSPKKVNVRLPWTKKKIVAPDGMRTLGVIRVGHSGYLFEKKKISDVTKFYDEKCSKWPKTRSKHKTATVIFFFFFRKNLDIQLFSYLFLIGHSVLHSDKWNFGL